jgi:hypothetical protein
VSFVSSTGFYYFNDGQVEDISEYSGFSCNTSSLYFRNLDIGGYILQVTESKIVISKPDLDNLYTKAILDVDSDYTHRVLIAKSAGSLLVLYYPQLQLIDFKSITVDVGK